MNVGDAVVYVKKGACDKVRIVSIEGHGAEATYQVRFEDGGKEINTVRRHLQSMQQPAPRKRRREEVTFDVGDVVIYSKGGEKVQAHVVSVNTESGDYTIRIISSGREIQTEETHLIPTARKFTTTDTVDYVDKAHDEYSALMKDAAPCENAHAALKVLKFINALEVGEAQKALWSQLVYENTIPDE